MERVDGSGLVTTSEAGLAESPRGLTKGLDAICEVLAADRPLNLLLAGSLVAACVWCAWLFDPGFLLGTSPYWSNPRGIVGNSWADISSVLSGDYFFQRDIWRLPLFYVDKLGGHDGTNIIFTGSVVWVALAERLWFLVTGTLVNLYGAWTAGCFVASAMTMTALVGKLGQRNIAAAAMATTAGLCMPALLARWGHLSLMAQFEIPLALIFYLHNRRSSRAWWLLGQAAGLTLLAQWTNNYIFTMVAAIVFVTIAQAATDRTLSLRSAAFVLAVLSVEIAGVIVLSGHLRSRGILGAGGDNPFFSMNLISPIMPQYSGLFPSMRNTIIDATGKQYEGFSYLGGGVLLLLFATIPRQLRTIWTGIRRQPWLSSLLLGCTLFAISNTIYLGSLLVLHFPLPLYVERIASMFRSDGRFIWPVMYCLTALAIAAAVPLHGRRAVLLLCLASALQWIDSEPLREAFAMSTRAPEKPLIDLADWQAAMARHRSVRVLPQYICLAQPRGWNSEITVQLQLLAAIVDRPINTVYAARLEADCAADQRIDGTPRPGERRLSVFLNEFAGFPRMQALAAKGDNCRASPGLVVCSDIPGEARMLTSTQTDRQ